MSTYRFFLVVLFNLLIGQFLFAQCSFDPTITISPVDADGIYCPDQTITLTTQNYDSYQWFFNFSNNNSGGTPWAGGSTNSIDVGASEWAVVYFYVEATDGGCTEASPTVVWDAWNFLPPSISSSGQSEYCTGESTEISNAFPGPSIFQWYKDGVAIDGATGSSYNVTETGTYTLSAAYAECPDYWQSSGVGPSFTFSDPIIPQISEVGGDLVADSGVSWQWLLDGTEIPGATQNSIKAEAEGMYQVRVVDVNGCDAISAPFLFPPGPLSINLTSFEVRSTDCNIHVNWTLNPSSDLGVFKIQFSPDGINYQTVQEISRSDASQSKYATSLTVAAAEGYFRLYISEFDGNVTITDAQYLDNICQAAINCCEVFPNPVEHIMHIKNPEEQSVQLEIVNAIGEKMFIGQLETSNHQLDVSTWPNAVYYATFTYSGKQESFLFVKK